MNKMKNILFFIGIIVGFSVLFMSCNINKDFEFNEKDAYVAFSTNSYSVDEDFSVNKDKNNEKNFMVPVMLASVSGKSSTVTFKVVDGTAKADVNYKLVSGTKLTFSSTARVQYIEFEIIEIPGVFTGDLNFSIEITDGGDVNIGAVKVCTVRIMDLDHPLSMILGRYNVNCNGYWDGPISHVVTISKDDDDISKVWFNNFFNLNVLPFYAIVNEDKTEIRLPSGQPTTATAALRGWHVLEDGEWGATISDGFNIIIHIEDEGQRLIMDPLYVIGSNVTGGGWHEIFEPYIGPDDKYELDKPMMVFTKL